MKNTLRRWMVLTISILTVTCFLSCEKAEIPCNERKSEKADLKPGTYRLTLLPDRMISEAYLLSGEDQNADDDAKRGTKTKKATGVLIADGISTSEFYVDFNAVLNSGGVAGNVNWSGTRFGTDTLKVTFLNVSGKSAVVGAQVTSDEWYFPKGYYIAFLIRDNGKSGSPADQLNMSLYYSSSDKGSGLTPSSTFWNTEWYTLSSQVSVR